MASASIAYVDGGVLRVGGSVFALRHVSGTDLTRVTIEPGTAQRIAAPIARIVLGLPAFLLGLTVLLVAVEVLFTWAASGSLAVDEAYVVGWPLLAAMTAVCSLPLVLLHRDPRRWCLEILLSGGETAIELIDRRRAPLEELQRQISQAAVDDTYRGPVVTIGDVIIGNQIDSGGGSVQIGGSGNESGPRMSGQAIFETRGMTMGDHIENNRISSDGGTVQVGGRGNVARISNSGSDQIPVATEAIRALAALVPAPVKEQLESVAQEVEQADPANKAGIAMVLAKAQGVIGTVSGTVTQAAGAASAVAAAIKALGF